MKKCGFSKDFEEYAKKYDVVFYVIEYLRTNYGNEYVIKGERNKRYSLIKPLQCYYWNNTNALFAYFVWCVSVECYKHGFNIFKRFAPVENDKNDLTACICDTQRFNYFFPVDYEMEFLGEIRKNKPIDRKTMQAVKLEYTPKGGERISKIIRKSLQKFFI